MKANGGNGGNSGNWYLVGAAGGGGVVLFHDSWIHLSTWEILVFKRRVVLKDIMSMILVRENFLVV